MTQATHTTFDARVADFHQRFDARIQTVIEGLNTIDKNMDIVDFLVTRPSFGRVESDRRIPENKGLAFVTYSHMGTGRYDTGRGGSQWSPTAYSSAAERLTRFGTGVGTIKEPTSYNVYQRHYLAGMLQNLKSGMNVENPKPIKQCATSLAKDKSRMLYQDGASFLGCVEAFMPTLTQMAQDAHVRVQRDDEMSAGNATWNPHTNNPKWWPQTDPVGYANAKKVMAAFVALEELVGEWKQDGYLQKLGNDIKVELSIRELTMRGAARNQAGAPLNQIREQVGAGVVDQPVRQK